MMPQQMKTTAGLNSHRGRDCKEFTRSCRAGLVHPVQFGEMA